MCKFYRYTKNQSWQTHFLYVNANIKLNLKGDHTPSHRVIDFKCTTESWMRGQRLSAYRAANLI